MYLLSFSSLPEFAFLDLLLLRFLLMFHFSSFIPSSFFFVLLLSHPVIVVAQKIVTFRIQCAYFNVFNFHPWSRAPGLPPRPSSSLFCSPSRYVSFICSPGTCSRYFRSSLLSFSSPTFIFFPFASRSPPYATRVFTALLRRLPLVHASTPLPLPPVPS